MRVILLLLALAMISPAQHPERDMTVAQESASRYVGDSKAIQAGQESYQLVCSGCHGMTGEGGRGPNLITGKGVNKATDDELFRLIKDGIPGSDMPPSPLEETKVWQITAYVRSLTAPAIDQGVAGDQNAGKALFYGRGGCTNCHMIRGEGGYLGPDLTNLGVTQNLARIREGLLDPNKRFTDGFDPVIVTLADGTRVEGVAKNHSNYALQILDRDGRLHLLGKGEAATIEFRDKSWMPANYSERLSEDEIQDLLAFLSRLALARVEIAGGGASR